MDCIFCNIVSKKSTSWTIYQDEYISAFFDYFPASKWHILIVPNNHYKDIFEIPEEIIWKISILAKKIAVFYNINFWIENLNILQSNWKYAWQEVFHYHMHIIPRNKNDNINFNWWHNEEIRNEYDELKKFITNKWI